MKKIAILVLASFAIFAMVSCGGKSKEKKAYDALKSASESLSDYDTSDLNDSLDAAKSALDALGDINTSDLNSTLKASNDLLDAASSLKNDKDLQKSLDAANKSLEAANNALDALNSLGF